VYARKSRRGQFTGLSSQVMLLRVPKTPIFARYERTTSIRAGSIDTFDVDPAAIIAKTNQSYEQRRERALSLCTTIPIFPSREKGKS